MATPPLDLGLLPLNDKHAKSRDEAGQQATKAKNCAECRRLKIKCDRKIPCSNCEKRGRASICPNGSLGPRSGRMVLTGTEDLHAKIEQLTSRIQDLEAALADLQSKVSSEPHPLLTYNQVSTEPVPRSSDDANTVPLSTYGSLITKDDGSAAFFGGTSAAEWVLALQGPKSEMNNSRSSETNNQQEEHRPSENDVGEFSSLYPNIVGVVPDILLSYTDFANPSAVARYSHPSPPDTPAASAFGSGSDSVSISAPTDSSSASSASVPSSGSSRMSKYTDRSSLMDVVLKGLPSKADATNMINKYYGHVTIDNDPVPRKRLLEEYFIPCYDHFENTPHLRRSLSLLYAIFALGTFSPPGDLELSHRYISLSRAALMIDDIVVNTTTTTIDTLILQFTYMRMRGGPGVGQRAWVMFGEIVRLAQAMGLHRDPAGWGLSPKETLYRRRSMWELVHIDLWMAFHFGRPPMISRQHFDVEMPMDDPDIAEPIPNFLRGKYLFCLECLWPLLDVALAAKDRTTYAAVLKVDKTLRDWVVPYRMQVPQVNPREDQIMIYEIQRTMVFIVREVSLLSLHKAYFAVAVSEPPFEPLKSKYSRSVLAAYGSACAILAHVRGFHARNPQLFEKVPFFATQGFTAACMLGAMAATVPDCPLSASALVEFNLTLEVFKQLMDSSRLKHILPILLALRPKAHAAVESHKHGIWVRPTEVEPIILQSLGGGRALVLPLHKRAGSSGIATSSFTLPLTSTPPTFDSREAHNPQVAQSVQESQPVQVARELEEDSMDSGEGQHHIGQIQMSQLTDFEIFLDNYLQSFDPNTSINTGNGNSGFYGNAMQVQSSDEFLRGALTGDWAGLSRTGTNNVYDVPVSTQFGSYGSPPGNGGGEGFGGSGSGHSPLSGMGDASMSSVSGSASGLAGVPEVPSQGQGVQSWGYLSTAPMMSNLSSSANSPYGTVDPALAMGQPTPPTGTGPSPFSQTFYTGGGMGSTGMTSTTNMMGGMPPMGSVSNTNPMGSISYSGANPSLMARNPPHYNPMNTSGGFGVNYGSLNQSDAQAALQWDDFLRGLGPNRDDREGN